MQRSDDGVTRSFDSDGVAQFCSDALSESGGVAQFCSSDALSEKRPAAIYGRAAIGLLRFSPNAVTIVFARSHHDNSGAILTKQRTALFVRQLYPS